MLSGPADVDAVRKQMRRKENAPNKPGPVKIMMTGMLMVPVGMAIGLMTKLFLDPDITPEAVNYLPLLAFVAAAHLALLGGVALIDWLRIGVGIAPLAVTESFGGDEALRRMAHEELLDELAVHGTLVFSSAGVIHWCGVPSLIQGSVPVLPSSARK